MQEQLTIMFAVIAGAAVVPLFARNIGVPSAALEILYGVVLFNFFIYDKPEWFALLKELGLIYLMFIAGMELDLGKLFKGTRIYFYVVVACFPFLLMPYLFVRMDLPLYLGVAVSMFSVGLVLPVLRESGLMKSQMGEDIIGIAITGEMLSILVLTALDIYHKHSSLPGSFLQAVRLVVFLSLTVIFLRLLYLIAWWNPERVEKIMKSQDPVEEGIRAVIAMVLAAALAAYASGVEPILGSFMAGAVIGYVFKGKGRFEDKINAMGFGFFIPFFFIGVGANFDVSLLGSVQGLIISLYLTGAVFLGKIIPLALFRPMGLKAVEGLAVALLISCPFTMLVIAGDVGERMKFIGHTVNNSLVLTAIMSSIIYTMLFRPLGKSILKKISMQELKDKA